MGLRELLQRIKNSPKFQPIKDFVHCIEKRDKFWVFVGTFGAIILLILTYSQLEQNAQALQAQQAQYTLDNRPFLYVSGLDVASNYNQTYGDVYFRINMADAGKLPAKIYELPNITIILDGNQVPNEIKQINRYDKVFYPNQPYQWFDVSVSGAQLNRNFSKFEFKISINYYAATDTNKTNKFYYYADEYTNEVGSDVSRIILNETAT